MRSEHRGDPTLEQGACLVRLQRLLCAMRASYGAREPRVYEVELGMRTLPHPLERWQPKSQERVLQDLQVALRGCSTD